MHAGDIRFLFGIDATPNLDGPGRANCRPRRTASWSGRRGTDQDRAPAASPSGTRREIVRERGFETIHTLEEMVAEFDYRPAACQNELIAWSCSARTGDRQGAVRLFEEYRYFFYHHQRPRRRRPTQIVFQANDRCDQENLIAQLKGGVQGPDDPGGQPGEQLGLHGHGELAWTLKAWAALLVPETPRHAQKHRAEKRTLLRMEFKTFRAAMIEMPCQIIRSGRRSDLSVAVVEPVAGCIFAAGGAAAWLLVVLRPANSEAGVWMPRSV